MRLRYTRLPLEREGFIKDIPLKDYKNWFTYSIPARGVVASIYIPGIHFSGETDKEFSRRDKRQRKIADWKEDQV